jgi:hypothetical protein
MYVESKETMGWLSIRWTFAKTVCPFQFGTITEALNHARDERKSAEVIRDGKIVAEYDTATGKVVWK